MALRQAGYSNVVIEKLFEKLIEEKKIWFFDLLLLS